MAMIATGLAARIPASAAQAGNVGISVFPHGWRSSRADLSASGGAHFPVSISMSAKAELAASADPRRSDLRVRAGQCPMAGCEGYRHGFRASELVDLRWDQIDYNAGAMVVRRAKKGTPSTHPIRGDEMRALRKLAPEQAPKSPFVFTSERGSPFTTAGFARMIERAGVEARLGFKAHPHMLRHACGFALANKGHDTRALQAYLGHKNIQHTVRYTELAPTRFKDFWRD
jgi:site-specific recombinase XerC